MKDTDPEYQAKKSDLECVLVGSRLWTLAELRCSDGSTVRGNHPQVVTLVGPALEDPEVEGWALRMTVPTDPRRFAYYPLSDVAELTLLS